MTSPSGACFPVLSFLHVPGKMSKPLWLMMGTAFRVSPLVPGSDKGSSFPESAASMQRPLFLTAKHTFAPWDFMKDSAALKIPEDFRKARYVIGKMYVDDESTGNAIADKCGELSIVSVHPTLDVALLTLRSWPAEASAAKAFSSSTSLPLIPPWQSLAKDDVAVIEGFRGVGRLGELDTFDPSLLLKLPPAERDALIRELENVEGRQTRTFTHVKILDPLGMCHGVGETHSTCYHGMSGGPVVVSGPDDTSYCAGILYGKHPDYPQNIGYTPSSVFSEWLRTNISRVEAAAPASLSTK